MNILVVVLFSVIAAIGIVIVLVNSNSKKENMALGKMNKALADQMGYYKKDNLFNGTHYYMSLYKYNVIRLVVVGSMIVAGMMMVSKALILSAILLYFAFYPKVVIGKMQTPFCFLLSKVIARDKKMKDNELLEVLSLLKNMMIRIRASPKGADYIIEYLADTADLTQTAFMKLLNYLRLGRPDEAEKKFTNEIGTPLSVDTARILMMLDNVEPIVLEQELVSIQEQIREIDNTYRRTTNEACSELVMIPIVITVMLIFLNFLVVAFIGELSELSYIFNV